MLSGSEIAPFTEKQVHVPGTLKPSYHKVRNTKYTRIASKGW